jgi:hypothetical protein
MEKVSRILVIVAAIMIGVIIASLTALCVYEVLSIIF